MRITDTTRLLVSHEYVVAEQVLLGLLWDRKNPNMMRILGYAWTEVALRTVAWAEKIAAGQGKKLDRWTPDRVRIVETARREARW